MAEEWWQAFFDDLYLDHWTVGLDPTGRASVEAAFIERALGLAAGSRVLDACCGEGRHCRELKRRGFEPVGVDQSAPSIARARAADAAGTYLLCDVRDLACDAEFDAAINMFTAFGYFSDEAEHRRMLAALARSLKPGGRLFMDLLNRDGVVKRFQPRDWRAGRGGYVLEERRYDPLTERIEMESIFLLGGVEHRRRTSIRTFSPHELGALLGACGLAPVAWYGAFDGSALGVDSPRLIVVAEKRA